MASRRQRRKIGEKKKRRKTRAARTPIKKKTVKRSSALWPQDCDERRRPEKRTCDLCGVGRIHKNDYFCPYNYIHGLFSLRTCKERCPPGRGRHPLLLDSAAGSGTGSQHQLRRLVRVTNVPLSVIPDDRELRGLFRRFGPLGMCLTSSRRHDPVGFGWVAFENREHAEEAITKLNGHLVGGRRLRVDWVYPH